MVGNPVVLSVFFIRVTRPLPSERPCPSQTAVCHSTVVTAMPTAHLSETVFVPATNAEAHLSSMCPAVSRRLQRMGSVAHCSLETGWYSRMQLSAQEIMVPGGFPM